MASIADGYYKHRLYQYNAATDTYQLISPWISTRTVECENGETAEHELARLENSLEAIIDDTTTTTANAWSSSKITQQLATAPQINDNLTSTQTVWSSDKAYRYRQHFQTVEAGKTVNLDMFEGFFAIVRATTATKGIIGVVDRWGGITYLQNNCRRELKRKDGTPYMGGLAEVKVNGNVVSVTNNTTDYIIVYFFTTNNFK